MASSSNSRPTTAGSTGGVSNPFGSSTSSSEGADGPTPPSASPEPPTTTSSSLGHTTYPSTSSTSSSAHPHPQTYAANNTSSPRSPTFAQDENSRLLAPGSPTTEHTRMGMGMTSPLRSSPLNPTALSISPTPPPSSFSFTRPAALSGASSSLATAPSSSLVTSTSSSTSRPASRSSSTTHFLSARPRTAASARSADDAPSSPLSPGPFSPGTTLSMSMINRESSAFSFADHDPGSRGSMILYRLADDPRDRDSAFINNSLQPPKLGQRNSVASSRDSMYSFSGDSKYPSGVGVGVGYIPQPRGLVPYAYEPELDDGGPPDEEDFLHDPNAKGGVRGQRGAFPWRGILNVAVIVVLIGALLCLFVLYPVVRYYGDRERNLRIEGNVRINATGQAPVLFQMPQPIDPDTPQSARTRTGFDGQDYELVFSDEFNVEGRSFYPGDDPFWEAVDLWYGVTGDVEWYDPSQVVTKDGHLVITIDSTDTAGRGGTKGSTAPFTAADNHGLKYRSGMVQTWNKFCFTSGYVEVSVTFPGPTSSTAGYWPGAWTMGNLGRPGYQATTDGMWPYTYDECDLGTFPNQTNPDGATPAAAKFSDQSRSRYNNELSWLSGQRASACSCPGSDHPGPAVNVGRGAPEIDIFEASIDKVTKSGGTVSQSAQFAPFAHDYSYQNDSEDKWKNFDPGRTRANTFKGSAVQQSVSGVTTVPDDMFQGSGAKFTSFGFEYYGHPQHRDDGYVMWQVDGKPTHRVGAGAVGADMGAGGAMIGRRLIPEEPMALVLNLGMSPNWQDIVESSMMFPGEMLVDYVRVYQRKNEINVGCDPKGYPTKKYIDDHLEAYQDVNMTLWKWDKPKNSLWSGGC
ncbi:beta-glucan synthesis-associated protein-domain-containing protein [Ephemerocybe angulata]|uniref:Beta-glucan synthesis-associated protein-domain-containing protein n=1 Tax=Ephemerocybe angulata TaxID=980116 RepID=A0A8H6LV92_9AGAR|nr:beta-glucan synthesis-associated protein-domain-containing protein [Tulosesus angulatus]